MGAPRAMGHLAWHTGRVPARVAGRPRAGAYHRFAGGSRAAKGVNRQRDRLIFVLSLNETPEVVRKGEELGEGRWPSPTPHPSHYGKGRGLGRASGPPQHPNYPARLLWSYLGEANWNESDLSGLG